MAKSRLFKKNDKIRFSLYGKDHYVSHVNERGKSKLNKIIGRDDTMVEIVLETPDYENDSKAMIEDVACHVENIVYPQVKPITLTEPTPMTFDLLYNSQEHDEFEVEDGDLVFDDKGLKIWIHNRIGRRFLYNDNEMFASLTTVEQHPSIHVFRTAFDVKKGSVIPMMRCVEDSGLEWSTMQECIEATEDFAKDYMEEFSRYVINTYCDGVPF
ncbi:MAG: hypothetical protein OXM61_10965 [Candidatus Poribacteria bacterium]|nr:hypothetical protein [Candidatus Poribacteria bacterium]